MAPALKQKRAHLPAGQIALIDATDDAAAAMDLLTLLYWAGVGMGKEHGSAVARGAMIAHDHLELVRARMQEARDEIQWPNHTAASGPEGTTP